MCVLLGMFKMILKHEKTKQKHWQKNKIKLDLLVFPQLSGVFQMKSALAALPTGCDRKLGLQHVSRTWIKIIFQCWSWTRIWQMKYSYISTGLKKNHVSKLNLETYITHCLISTFVETHSLKLPQTILPVTTLRWQRAPSNLSVCRMWGWD